MTLPFQRHTPSNLHSKEWRNVDLPSFARAWAGYAGDNPGLSGMGMMEDEYTELFGGDSKPAWRPIIALSIYIQSSINWRNKHTFGTTLTVADMIICSFSSSQAVMMITW